MFHLINGITLVLLLRSVLGKHWYISSQGKRIKQKWMKRLADILELKIRQSGTPVTAATLLVSNHISWLDIICLNSVIPVSFVAKGSVKRWPLIGFLAAASGTLFIDREKRYLIQRTQNEIGESIRRGSSVMIFPEGTTTDGKELKKFNPSLFQVAVDQKCKVQACSVLFHSSSSGVTPAPFIGDDNFASHLHRILKFGSIMANVTFYKPLVPTENIHRKELAIATWQQINRGLFPFSLPSRERRITVSDNDELAWQTEN